jgi:hypothetical protein
VLELGRPDLTADSEQQPGRRLSLVNDDALLPIRFVSFTSMLLQMQPGEAQTTEVLHTSMQVEAMQHETGNHMQHTGR